MFADILNNALNKNNIVLSSDQREQIIQYLELIQQWNRVYNLTAITDPTEMVYLHIIDSLLVASHLTGNRFLDVGTGAGLPGIPLAILNPEQQWTLLDKNSKKTRFLMNVVAELKLKNVNVVHTRVEDLNAADPFDGIISRALSTIALFTTTSAHLLAPTGRWYAMKGKYPEQELLELPSGFQIKERLALTLKGMAVERHLIIIGKE
jgi:16S rRNA (guanine527-N7)-methyltransferase